MVNTLGVLEINPYWGTKTGCFPATSRGLANSGPTYQATDNGLRSLRHAWTDLYSPLRPKDKEDLKFQAKRIRTKIEGLKNQAEANLEQWKDVRDYGNKAGWDLGDNVTGKGGRTRRLGEWWDAAGANLRILGVNRRAAFSELDMLMVYSPKPEVAVELCEHKAAAFGAYQKFIDEIAVFHREISTQVAKRLQEQDDFYKTLLKLFQGFMAILDSIIALIKSAFEVSFVLFQWAVKHPKVTGGVAVAVGVLVLGLILKPYLTIAQAIF